MQTKKRPPESPRAAALRHSTKWSSVATSLVADSDELSRRDAHERGRRIRGRLLVQHDLQALVRRQTRTGRDEPAHDDVLLDAAEIVGLAADGGFGEHLGGFLEGRSRDEGL